MENLVKIKKSRLSLIKFAREQFRKELNFMEDKKYHCGVRFYSDTLVNEKMDKGFSVGGALAKLATEDFESL